MKELLQELISDRDALFMAGGDNSCFWGWFDPDLSEVGLEDGWVTLSNGGYRFQFSLFPITDIMLVKRPMAACGGLPYSVQFLDGCNSPQFSFFLKSDIARDGVPYSEKIRACSMRR